MHKHPLANAVGRRERKQ